LVAERFRRYADEGASIAELTRWLTDQGVATRTGKSRWDRSVIWGMLRNPAYTGRAVYGKTIAVNESPGLNRRARLEGRTTPRATKTVDRPREEWTHIPVPAIIDDNKFERVALRLEDNKRFASRNSKTPACCEGWPHAPAADTATTAPLPEPLTRRSSISDAWAPTTCGTTAGGSAPTNRPRRLPHQVVWDHVTGLLADPHLIRTEIKRLDQASTADPTNRQRKTLELALAKAITAITRMIEAFSEQLVTIDELHTRMPDLRARETNLRNQISALDTQQADRDLYLSVATNIEAFLTELNNRTDSADIDERQRVLRLVVKDVLIGPENVTIRHRIPAHPRATSGTHEHGSTDTEGDHSPSYPLRCGRNNPALRGPGVRARHLSVLHHPRAQDRTQQLQQRLVTDTFLDRLHQRVVRNRRKAVGDVRLDHPPAASQVLIHEHLQGIVRCPLRAEPERAAQHVRLEDRFEHDLHSGLHNPVPNSGNRQWTVLVRGPRLGDHHPTCGRRTVPTLAKFGGHLVKQPGYPVLLDLGQSDPVDARCAVVTAHHDPRAPQDVSAVDLVHQRVEPTSGIGLGRPVKRVLQGSDRIQRRTSASGGTSRIGTHQAPPQPQRIDEVAALPSPPVVLSGRLKRYYGRLRRPPGQPTTSRDHRL
jgi:site-specific DNA recombinase